MTLYWALLGVGALALAALAFFAGRRGGAAALRESEARFRAIADHSPDHLIVQDKALRYVFVMNPQLGLTPEDMLGRTDHDFLPADDAEKLTAVKKWVLEEGKPMHLETSLHSPAGEQWFDGSYVPRLGKDGRVDGLIGYFRNVTEAKQAQAALRERTAQLESGQVLREEQQRLTLLTDNVPAMIAYVDIGLQYRYGNLRYRRFYAGSDAPISGRLLPEVLTPQAWDAARPWVERALAGEAVSYSGERQLHDGSVRHVQVSLVPHRDTASLEVRGMYILAMDITAQHQAEMALREREAGLSHAQQMARLAHVVVGPDGAYERWSENFPRLLGLEAPRIPRSTRESLALLHPGDRERFRSSAIEAGRSGLRRALEYRVRRGDGALIHLRQTMEPLGEPGADGRRRWFVTMQDVTEQKLAEERIRRLNRMHATLSAINAAIVRIGERQALFDEVCRIAVENGGFLMAWIGLVDRQAATVRPTASAGDDVRGFLDAAPLEVVETRPGGHGLAGRAVRELKPMVSNDVQGDPQRLMKKECAERGINSLAVLPLVVGGEAIGVIALYATEAGFFDEDEMRLLTELAGDIAFALDHIQKEEQLRYLAYYDPLTGLANRTLLLERLAQYADIARAAQHRVALILIDIERFKAINDSFGRQVGDELLKQVGARLAEIAGSATHVARVAADQFAIVAPRVRSERNLVERLEQGSRRLDGEPYRVAGNELRIATRAGVALFPDDGGDAEALFRNAESALKKAAAGEPFTFYTPQMNARLAETLSLEHKLRLAVERREFVLHYQPKVDCNSRRVLGMEALIRWQSPDLGLVPPMRFIPLLEETGLIHPVGSWALRQAALDHRRWVELGLEPPRVAVNVSAIQLRRADFVAAVEQAIKDGVAPTAIDLEITESAIMEEAEASIAKLLAVRALGVDIAIDDFGTGYSSLGYLTRLPVRSLKIDRSFVVGMVHHTDTMTLVTSIMSLAHSLRLKVVAEGVDSEEQVKYLQLLRCDEMQGYLFSKPVPAAEIEALLRRPVLSLVPN